METIKEIIAGFKLKHLEKSLLRKTPDELKELMGTLEIEYLEIKSCLDNGRPKVIYLSFDELDVLERLERKSNESNLVRSVYLQTLENKYLRKCIRG